VFQPFKTFQPFQSWKQTFGAGISEQPDLSFFNTPLREDALRKKDESGNLKV
jgi:hypothetical protein